MLLDYTRLYTSTDNSLKSDTAAQHFAKFLPGYPLVIKPGRQVAHFVTDDFPSKLKPPFSFRASKVTVCHLWCCCEA